MKVKHEIEVEGDKLSIQFDGTEQVYLRDLDGGNAMFVDLAELRELVERMSDWIERIKEAE